MKSHKTSFCQCFIQVKKLIFFFWFHCLQVGRKDSGSNKEVMVTLGKIKSILNDMKVIQSNIYAFD